VEKVFCGCPSNRCDPVANVGRFCQFTHELIERHSQFPVQEKP
jgi:hypothetical protein